MSDGFDRELAALREEVGKFVLEVLQRDEDKILDEVAAGLTRRLNRSVSLNAVLTDLDRRMILELQRALAELRQRPGFAPGADVAADPEGPLLSNPTFADQQLRFEPSRSDPPGPSWLGRHAAAIGGAVAGLAAGALLVILVLQFLGGGIDALWTRPAAHQPAAVDANVLQRNGP